METEADCISKEVLIARLWGCNFLYTQARG